MKEWKRLRKQESAQALVEFAIVLPILLLLILGMIEFGWLLNAKITLNSAVREGARVGAVLTVTGTERETVVAEAVKDTSDTSGLTILNVSVTQEDDDGNNVHNIIVTVQAEVEPIIGLYVQDNVSMDSEARMRRE